jgi:hypothetical protein
MMVIDLPTAMFVLSLVTVLSGLLGAVIRGVWKLSTKLSTVEQSLRKEIGKSRDEIEERQEQHSREFGETVHAMGQKIRDFELWVRDHCVLTTNFDKVQGTLESSIHSLGQELKADLRRMEDKIDSKA